MENATERSRLNQLKVLRKHCLPELCTYLHNVYYDMQEYSKVGRSNNFRWGLCDMR